LAHDAQIRNHGTDTHVLQVSNCQLNARYRDFHYKALFQNTPIHANRLKGFIHSIAIRLIGRIERTNAFVYAPS